MSGYDRTAWGDDTADKMRDYYEANRPLRWWQKRNPPGSWGCVADNLMLGLLNIALAAQAEWIAETKAQGDT
jgi:hypothetical protein